MGPHYRIIDQCLQLLRQCEMPPIMKLRVKIHLIHLKRILLSNAPPPESCSESALNRVLDDIRGMGNGGPGITAGGDLMDHLADIISGLPNVETVQQSPPDTP